MSSPLKSFEPVRPARRAALGTVALVASGSLVAALLGLFESQAGMPWLLDTPENLARMATCDSVQRGSAQWQLCRERVVQATVMPAVPHLAQAQPATSQP